jgi:2OG-Fe(II) oxygenase superfamily
MSATKAKAGKPGPVIKTTYTSKSIPIPDSFLSTSAANVGQVTYNKIDFSKTALPEYTGLYAVVLDNVLSPAECTELIKLAQLSAGAGEPGVENDGWQPAMINAGPEGEFMATDYRNSDRIIWDEKTVMHRLLMRCFLSEQVQKDLAVIDGSEHILGQKAVRLGHRWKLTRLNERMRFLRYGKGQFFKEHCDGTYITPDRRERTFYTLHLYLNDSVSANPASAATSTSGEAAPFPELLIKGGATTFHSNDMARRLDVDPKAGRVLIFQHRDLLHSGDEVLEGVKYTMRTDLMFEFEGSGDLGRRRQH